MRILTKKSGVFCKYLANVWWYWVGTFAKTLFRPVPSFPPSFNAIVPIVRPAIECKQTHKQGNKHADILLYISRLAELPGVAQDVFKNFLQMSFLGS